MKQEETIQISVINFSAGDTDTNMRCEANQK